MQDNQQEDDEDEGYVVVGSEGDDSDAAASESKNTDETPQSQSTPQTNLDEDDEDDLYTPDNDVILANKRAHPVLSGLFRSKGTIWLATRPTQRGSWSQAGAMLTIVGDVPFLCTMDPKDYLSGDEEIDKMMKFNIEKGGEWGDREQEVVFIGYKLDKQRLSELLDECLLNDEEWGQWQTIMRDEETDLEAKVQELYNVFDDGFPEWDDEDDHDHEHGEGDDHGHGHAHGLGKTKRSIDNDGQEIPEVD